MLRRSDVISQIFGGALEGYLLGIMYDGFACKEMPLTAWGNIRLLIYLGSVRL